MCLLMMQCIPSVALNMCCNCSRYHAHHFECNILARLLPNKTSNHRNQHILKRKKSKTTNKPSDIEIMQTCFFVTQKTQLTLPQPFLRKSTTKKIGIIDHCHGLQRHFFFANGPLNLEESLTGPPPLGTSFPRFAPNEDLIAEIVGSDGIRGLKKLGSFL